MVPALYRSPPSDALILFDGNGLDAWSRRNGKPAAWNHTDAYFEVAPWRGSIQTREAFGDVQLHLEWMIPAGSRGRGQHRGNSGVKLMGHYEIQILDSFQNETYPTGLAGAVYGQTPPLVNASLPQGEWQAFDIVFRRPHFDAEGRLVRAASVTVFHNGVIVQDAVPLTGPTSGQSRPYEAHPSRLPLLLQDHRRRVRFRNVWIRDLE